MWLRGPFAHTCMATTSPAPCAPHIHQVPALSHDHALDVPCRVGSSPARPGQKPPALARTRFTPTKLQQAASPGQPPAAQALHEQEGQPPAVRAARGSAKRRLLPLAPTEPAEGQLLERKTRQQAAASAGEQSMGLSSAGVCTCMCACVDARRPAHSAAGAKLQHKPCCSPAHKRHCSCSQATLFLLTSDSSPAHKGHCSWSQVTLLLLTSDTAPAHKQHCS